MKRNRMIKVCAVMALASCLTAGLGVVAASASTGEPTYSTQMTFGGAATKIVSNLKDSGLAFKYELDKNVFANTAEGEVAFATGASAGIIVSVEALPANFDANDETTYGGAKKFAIGAEYWGLNEGETKMQGFAYLYNIPNVQYDTEVTAIGYVTTSEGTTYTVAEKRSMAYVAHAAIKDESDKAPTEEQKLLLDGFLPNYSVTFTVDGEAFGAAQTVKYGEKAAVPAETPEKAGYTFDKWVVGEGDFDANAAITANVEVAAAFTQNLVYVPSVNVAKAAGAEILLNGTTNDLGVVYSDEATSVAYAVTKTVGGSTASASAVTLTDNKFTVEAGCLYDVEITINDTQKAYVQVNEESVIVVGNSDSEEFIIHGPTVTRVNTDGNISFKVEAASTTTNALVQIDSECLNDNIVAYDVYANLQHSYNLWTGSGTWMIQFADGSAAQGNGRFKIGTTSSVSKDGYHQFKLTAVMNRNNPDYNVVFDNIVLVPQSITIPSVEVAKTTGAEVTLNAAGLGYTLKNGLTDADVSFNVTKTVAGAAGMYAETKTTVTGTSFTVEEGCFYDVEMTITPKEGEAIYEVIKTPIKKYIFVYESTLNVYSFDGAGQTLSVANSSLIKAEKIVNEYGNVQYKISYPNASSANTTCNFVYNTKLTGLKIYGDFTVVGIDESNTSQKLSFNYNGSWPDVRQTGRRLAGGISSGGTSSQTYVMKSLNGVDAYVILDNVVFVA